MIARRSAVAALLFALALASTALAADPPRLEGTITDQTGSLDGSTGDIEAALDDLLKLHEAGCSCSAKTGGWNASR